jgi:hypothetical protein
MATSIPESAASVEEGVKLCRAGDLQQTMAAAWFAAENE